MTLQVGESGWHLTLPDSVVCKERAVCKLKGDLKGWLPKSDTSGSGHPVPQMSISRWGVGNTVLHLSFESALAGQGKDGEPGLMGTSEGGAGRDCKEQVGQ